MGVILFSDKNSPCCQNCQFMASGVKCREGQFATCEQESRCTGTGAECPKSPPMPDGTGCLERGKCRLGKCIPFCETQGLQSCMCDTSKFIRYNNYIIRLEMCNCLIINFMLNTINYKY